MRETEKPKGGTAFPKFGSRFRYSGRTQYQTRIDAEGSNRKEPNFIRGSSWRPGDGSLSEDNSRFTHLIQFPESLKKVPSKCGLYEVVKLGFV